MKWYKRDSDAFAFGTIGLSLEEVGAYTLILDAMYSRQSPLPDDDFLLRRIIRCHHHQWKKIKQSLINKGKLWVINGAIHAPRVLKELENFKSTPPVTPPVTRGVKLKKANHFNKNRPVESRSKTEKKPLKKVSSLSSARSHSLDALARSPPPQKEREKSMRAFTVDRQKAELIIRPDGSRVIRNIAMPTTTKGSKVYADGLPIGIDPVFGIPYRPGTQTLSWKPQFHVEENLLDCRPPWDRQADEDYQANTRYNREIIEPGQIVWAEVPSHAKVYSENDPQHSHRPPETTDTDATHRKAVAERAITEYKTALASGKAK